MCEITEWRVNESALLKNISGKKTLKKIIFIRSVPPSSILFTELYTPPALPIHHGGGVWSLPVHHHGWWLSVRSAASDIKFAGSVGTLCNKNTNPHCNKLRTKSDLFELAIDILAIWHLPEGIFTISKSTQNWKLWKFTIFNLVTQKNLFVFLLSQIKFGF